MTTINKEAVLEVQLKTILEEANENLKSLVYDNADKAEVEKEDALPFKERMMKILKLMPRVENEDGETDDDRMPIDRKSDLAIYLRSKIEEYTYDRLQDKAAYNIQYYYAKDSAGQMQWTKTPADAKLPEGTLTWTCTGSIARPDSEWKRNKGDPEPWTKFHKENRKRIMATCRQAINRLYPKIETSNGTNDNSVAARFAKNHWKPILNLRTAQANKGFQPCSEKTVKKILATLATALGISGTDEARRDFDKNLV